jgi:hypothetical protein
MGIMATEICLYQNVSDYFRIALRHTAPQEYLFR